MNLRTQAGILLVFLGGMLAIAEPSRDSLIYGTPGWLLTSVGMLFAIIGSYIVQNEHS